HYSLLHRLPAPWHLPILTYIGACSLCLYGDQHDLHSFPTRRSSDLQYIGSNPHNIYAMIPVGIPLFSVIISPPHFQNEYINFGKDRKSTRLNSSHVSISYAVFCLIKKNVINQP